MIEVLISLVIFAVGLLGVAALQTRAQQAGVESFQRARAVMLMEDMLGRINNNRAFRDCYWQQAASVGVNETPEGTGCDALADLDIAEWDALLEGAGSALDGTDVGGMIGARGCITQPAADQITVSVAWQGLAASQAPATNTCGQNAYGNENLRRVISNTITFGDLDG